MDLRIVKSWQAAPPSLIIVSMRLISSALRECLFRFLWGAVIAIAFTPLAACAGVTITKVVVDGKELPPSIPSPNGERGTLHVPAGARSLTIAYKGGWNESPPAQEPGGAAPMARGMRLRHRLDGIDPDWRDPPAKARVILQFQDADRQTIDSHEIELNGESSGWQGVAEVSEFTQYSISAKTPPNGVWATATFLSHGGDEVVGQIGVDDVAMTVQPADGGEVVRHALPSALESDQFNRLALPRNWSRRGSRGQMAQVRLRAVPSPHPILVLLDDDPTRFGNWSVAQGIAVQPGDAVTLSWQASHSLGVGGEAVAEYRDLAPGVYVFRAGAFRPGGQPTGHETNLMIEVVVPWYRRPEAWLVALMVAGGAAFAVGRSLAMRRIKRRLEEVERAHALERERTRIARDLHDEIGAGLTEIAMQNFWVQRELEGHTAAATLERVEKARQSAVDLVRSVDAIVWAVNPANDTLDRFVPYLTHSVEQFLDAAGVHARIEAPDSLPDMPLEGSARHSLFLVVREAVNNAVKHARPSCVWLTVRVEDGRLQIVVEDDGCGVAMERLSSGDADRSGLGNMRRRVEELAGRFVLEKRPEGGTRVTVDVSLAAAATPAVS